MADGYIPTKTTVYFEQDEKPFDGQVSFSVSCYGYVCHDAACSPEPGYSERDSHNAEVVFSYSASCPGYGCAIYEPFYVNHRHIAWCDMTGTANGTPFFPPKRIGKSHPGLYVPPPVRCRNEQHVLPVPARNTRTASIMQRRTGLKYAAGILFHRHGVRSKTRPVSRGLQTTARTGSVHRNTYPALPGSIGKAWTANQNIPWSQWILLRLRPIPRGTRSGISVTSGLPCLRIHLLWRRCRHPRQNPISLP